MSAPLERQRPWRGAKSDSERNGEASIADHAFTYCAERGTRNRNIRADARDTRLDLLYGLRLSLPDPARARLLGVVAELVALHQIRRATARELRILLRRPT